MVITSLAAPADVAADAADRNLAVSWSPVAGAARYIVAARFANGVEPFAWSEYDAPASPYVITDNWAAMSGLQYEVRAAAVNAAGRSEWSPAVTVTAPELRPAPRDAISVNSGGPYAVGDFMRVDLLGQRPFTRKSPFTWFVCEPGGADCRLLPRVVSPTSIYIVREAARGKPVHVQADYDKDGVSLTATAILGMVSADAPGPTPPPFPVLPPGCPETTLPSVADGFMPEPSLATHLHHLESKKVSIDWDPAGGGAVEPLCNDALVVSPWGGIALARSDGRVERIQGRVPMNIEAWLSAAPPDRRDLYGKRFRVADIMLQQRSEERWELFVTHHYFTGECVRFRLSSATILLENGNVTLSPAWRTLFDAEPCMSPGSYSGFHAGGRIAADGPGVLLIVVGDHRLEHLPQDPGSHIGKLVRVAIESGEAEILSQGFRNPQGIRAGRRRQPLETEHGPRGGDELNLLKPGANYGWPSVSYGIPRTGNVTARENEDVGAHEGHARPRYAWTPSIGVSAPIVNDERWFPLWKDDLLVASLTGSASNGLALFRVRRDGVNVRYVERIEVGYRIRDLTMMPDGRIGDVEGWSASQSLRSLDGVWTAERLAQFLADPQAFAPGAAMGTTGITEAEARAIADYIAGLRGE